MAASASAAANTNTANGSAQPVAVITGASRGIGLGLVEVYAKKGYRVIAAVRNPATSDKLQSVIKALSPAQAASVSAVALDVADSKSVAAFAGALGALKPAVTGVDVLINNAGILDARGANGATVGLSTLDTDTVASFEAVYRTNVVGVWELTHKLLPLLRGATAKGGAKVANISSNMGSVDDTVNGGWPPVGVAYRASKAALNELTAVQAREYNGATVAARTAAGADAKAAAAAAPYVTVVAVHPGWVETDMGSNAGKPPTTVAQSAAGIEAVVTGLPAGPKASFWDFEGKPMKW